MNLPTVKLNNQELSRFNEAVQKEWIVTNGLGGYASSTVLGLNTRKYHGLLVAALHPPGGRTVCLSKLDEEIFVDGNTYLLGANEFSGVFSPEGFRHLKEFSMSPFPRYIYSAGQVEVEKIVFMPSKKNSVAVIYKIRNESLSQAKIRIVPLVACRHFHSVIEKSRYRFQQYNGKSEVQLKFEEPKVTIQVSSTEGSFEPRPNWIERLFYREENARGESSVDDCFQPGKFEVMVPALGEIEFAVKSSALGTIEQTAGHSNPIELSLSEVKFLFQETFHCQSDVLKEFVSANPSVPSIDFFNWVLLAADSFVVEGVNGGKSVIAGYHWFESWGRDTFVSLPGLMLTTGRFMEARDVLVNFGRLCTGGLVPNFLSDLSLQPSCNTVDASLWYVNSVLQYLKYTGDFDFVRLQLWEILKDIVESHIKGTDYGIHVDKDGLLAHGPRLTWMDAEANGEAVTPREGKAVEIQALWYNALKTVQLIAMRFGEPNLADSFAELSEKARAAFNAKFWNDKRNCLFDVLEKSGVDTSLRPNQTIAVSLDFPILNTDRIAMVVDTVKLELLTPCGLRTLERDDQRYKPRYVGGRIGRDEAYHNGTVWPWLLGPFISAFLRAKGYSLESRNFAGANIIEPFFAMQIAQAGLGTVSEIFDGDPPHTPRGCISQAWSIAEPLRAYVEGVLGIEPKFEKEVLGL